MIRRDYSVMRCTEICFSALFCLRRHDCPRNRRPVHDVLLEHREGGRKISESMLKQNSAVSSVIRDQVYNVGNLLLSDKEIVNALLDKEADPVKQYGVFGTLNRVQSTYPFIHSIGIYNGLNNTYLNTKGITKEQEKALLEEINSKNTSYFHLFPRKISTTTSASANRSEDVLTFVLLPSYYSPLSSKGAIVINMSTDTIQDLIGGYRNEAVDSRTSLTTREPSSPIRIGPGSWRIYRRSPMSSPFWNRTRKAVTSLAPSTAARASLPTSNPRI